MRFGKKKIILIAAVLLVAALVTLFLIYRGRKVKSWDIEGQYPYSYLQTGKGLKMTVRGRFPKNTSWYCASENETVLSAAVKNQNRRRARFVMNAGKPGLSNVTYVLADESGDVPYSLYTITVEYFVNTDKTISVFSETHTEPEKPEEGKGEQFRYTVSKLGNGFSVTINGQPEMNWNALVSGERLTTELTGTEEEVCTLTVLGGAVAHGTIRLINNTDECILLDISYDTNGLPSLNSHVVLPWDPENTLQQDPNAYQNAFGLPRLPEEAVLISSGAELAVSETSGEEFLSGWARFRYEDIVWTLRTAKDRQNTDYVSDTAAEQSTSQTVQYYGLTVTACASASGKGSVSVWTVDGRTWCLESETATVGQMLHAMDGVMKATIYG